MVGPILQWMYALVQSRQCEMECRFRKPPWPLAVIERRCIAGSPDTIGAAVSSGCIRMTNRDVIDLYDRVKVGTKVVVLK